MTGLGRVRSWWRSLDRRVLDATVAALLAAGLGAVALSAPASSPSTST